MNSDCLADEKNQVYFIFMSFKTLINNTKTDDEYHSYCLPDVNAVGINLLFKTKISYSKQQYPIFHNK